TVLKNINELRSITNGNMAQQQNIDSLESLILNRISYSQKSVALVNSNQKDEAIALIKSNEGKEITDNIRKLTNHIQQHETNLLEAKEADVGFWKQYFNAVFILLTVTIIVILVLVFAAIYFNLNARQKAEKDLVKSKEMLQA